MSMQKVTHLENNKKFILLILTILLVFGILVVFVCPIDCIFKSITGFPCPSCGLTRGFRALLKGDIVSAFNYNILTIPIFISLNILLFLFIIDFIQKKDLSISYLLYFKKHYKLLIIIILISFIINIYKGI